MSYRRFLYMLTGNAVCLLCCALYLSVWQKMPDRITIRAGQEEKIDFSLPASGMLKASGEEFLPVSLNHPLVFCANQTNSYEMDVKLFGFLPLKNVEIEVIENKEVIPAGIPIGIYVKTKGVLVIGTGDFTGYDGKKYSPSQMVLKSGDYILKMNGEEITGKKMFINMLREVGEKDVILTIAREKEMFDIKVKPVQDLTGDYKIGLWIRDNAQGVGTLTYIDGKGGFGALGHGINDMDTGTLMALEKGNLYETQIIGIHKGESGKPGELTGMIDYSERNVWGYIDTNAEKGIYGSYGEELSREVPNEPVPIGLRQEVTTGPAEILCSLDGEEARYYGIEITDIVNDKEHVNREIMLKITDPELIERTGGIIQGMSGAPIIQNGKLVGAVTHVFVRDATKGYGIFIESMLNKGN